MAEKIAKLLAVLKWPLAGVSIFMILPALAADAALLRLPLEAEWFWPFFGAFGLMFVVWFSLMPELSNSFLNTFEHELTHLIFAVLTFNRPTGLDINQGDGAFTFKGRPNWLITIAPYFFPTFPAFIILGGLFFVATGQELPLVYRLIFGTFTGLYFCSTLSEIRANQTDLKRVGFFFSLCFLPGVHLICLGFLLGFGLKGFEGLSLYATLLAQKTVIFVPYLMEKVLLL